MGLYGQRESRAALWVGGWAAQTCVGSRGRKEGELLHATAVKTRSSLRKEAGGSRRRMSESFSPRSFARRGRGIEKAASSLFFCSPLSSSSSSLLFTPAVLIGTHEGRKEEAGEREREWEKEKKQRKREEHEDDDEDEAGEGGGDCCRRSKQAPLLSRKEGGRVGPSLPTSLLCVRSPSSSLFLRASPAPFSSPLFSPCS